MELEIPEQDTLAGLMKSPDRIAVGSHERENKSSSIIFQPGLEPEECTKTLTQLCGTQFPLFEYLAYERGQMFPPLPGRHEHVRATPRIASSVSAKLIGASWRSESSPAFLAVSVWFAASPVATSLPSRGRVKLPKMHLLCLAWPPVTNLYIHAGTNDEPGQEEEEVEEISTHTQEEVEEIGTHTQNNMFFCQNQNPLRTSTGSKPSILWFNHLEVAVKTRSPASRLAPRASRLQAEAFDATGRSSAFKRRLWLYRSYGFFGATRHFERAWSARCLQIHVLDPGLVFTVA